MQSFDVFLSAPVNNRDAGDLRRHRAHCDVIVMESFLAIQQAVFACRRVNVSFPEVLSGQKKNLTTPSDVYIYISGLHAAGAFITERKYTKFTMPVDGSARKGLWLFSVLEGEFC